MVWIVNKAAYMAVLPKWKNDGKSKKILHERLPMHTNLKK